LPSFLSTSAVMGTVELTGLAMMSTCAAGQTVPTACASSATMDALVLNRSSRVMPGLRGTPAGMTTTSAPSSALCRLSLPLKPVTLARVLMCDRSAATPGVLTMSYSDSAEMASFCFSSSDSGWPMPPAAPRTATLVACREAARERGGRAGVAQALEGSAVAADTAS
jgi:hypothetical protein